MVSTAAMTTSSTTPTANLLSHLGRSLDRHTAAVLLGDLLAVLLGDRGAGLLWCLDWNLLAVFLGYSGALLYWLLDRNAGTTLLGNFGALLLASIASTSLAIAAMS